MNIDRTDNKAFIRSARLYACLAAVLIVLAAVFCTCGCSILNSLKDNVLITEAVPTLSESENPPTPAAENPSDTSGMLLINELQNGTSGWVELYNASDREIDLEDYYISDNRSDPRKHRLPADVLAPGKYIVIELNSTGSEDRTSASFKLGRNENTLFLYYSDGRLADSMTFDPSLPELISAVRAAEETAYTLQITKGYANSDSTFPSLAFKQDAGDMPVIINEVMPDNEYGIMDSDGERSDWAELYNRSDAPVSLSGYRLSDREDDPARWALPDVTLGAGEYLIIFLSGKDRADGELHASFGLSDKDDGIYLFDYSSMTYCGIELPQGLNANISVGLGSDGRLYFYAAPTPGAANDTYGFNDYLGLSIFSPDGIYISEVSGVSAPRSGEKDWVELFNASDKDIDMTGWGLTDDPSDPYADTYPGCVLKAGSYKVMGISFGISQSGETLYLFDDTGAVRDVFETGVTMVGVTSGRESNSQTGKRVFFTTPTMGYANAEPFSGYAAEPVFSKTGLYCDSAFQLELSVRTEGASIRYTLDGSEPTAASHLYTAPISVTANCVVRAKAFLDGLVPSASVAHTYVFGAEHSLPVVCLALSQADYNRMYIASQSPNGSITKGDEVPSSMEYYIDGLNAFTTGAGVRVSGASTAVYAQKSLGLYFRGGYGRSSLDFPLFEGCDVTSFRSLVLRNGGQDAMYARLRDSYMSSVCSGLELDVAHYRPVVVYVNGDYWGIYDLKENMNEDYLASHYEADRDNVDIIKRNTVLLAGSREDWLDLREFCRTADFSKQENYDRLAELVDVYSIIDYIAARTYFYDGDMFNQKYWRISSGELKWRAVFYDSDYAMMGNSPAANILPQYFNRNGVASAHGSITNMDVFCALVQNAGWRDKFVLRYVYLVNYVFCPENAVGILDDLASVYAPEMQRHIARWPGMIASYAAWQSEVASLRSCVQSRSSYALGYLKSLFSLTNAQMAEYNRRTEIIYSGGADPGASSYPSAPIPAATPPPASAQPTPTPEPTQSNGASTTPTPGPTAAPDPTTTPDSAAAPEPTATPEP